jgi:hypothetical protein
MQTRCSFESFAARGRGVLALFAGLLLGACGTTSAASPAARSPGAGLSAVARGGLTTHGAEPSSRPEEPAAMLPTPHVWVHPHAPRAEGRTAEGMLYVSRVDLLNRGAVAVRAPAAEVETWVRAGDERRGCELQSVATSGVPTLEPGELRTVEYRSLCPLPEARHEVVSHVELPDLLGEDGLYAGRVVVAEAAEGEGPS